MIRFVFVIDYYVQAANINRKKILTIAFCNVVYKKQSTPLLET